MDGMYVGSFVLVVMMVVVYTFGRCGMVVVLALPLHWLSRRGKCEHCKGPFAGLALAPVWGRRC